MVKNDMVSYSNIEFHIMRPSKEECKTIKALNNILRLKGRFSPIYGIKRFIFHIKCDYHTSSILSAERMYGIFRNHNVKCEIRIFIKSYCSVNLSKRNMYAFGKQ